MTATATSFAESFAVGTAAALVMLGLVALTAWWLAAKSETDDDL
jgi:uncharacterized protein (DUF2062 family)